MSFPTASSSDEKQIEAVRHALEVAKRRRRELLSRTLTRAEEFELDMTENVIERGEAILRRKGDTGV